MFTLFTFMTVILIYILGYTEFKSLRQTSLSECIKRHWVYLIPDIQNFISLLRYQMAADGC